MKKLQRYLEKREAAINELLDQPLQSYTTESFHLLRVEIKKLNALFRLVNFCLENFSRKKLFKPFSEIFRQAGKVRELQVEWAVLKKYFVRDLLNAYRNDLKKKMWQEKQAFWSLLNKSMITRLKKTLHDLHPLIDQLKDEQVANYMAYQRKKIKALLMDKDLREDQLHELRKRLKRYYYNQNSISIHKQKKPLPRQDVLPELVGKWHDNQIILVHLKNAIGSKDIQPSELSQLKKIRSAIYADTSSLYMTLKNTIPSSRIYSVLKAGSSK